MIWRTFLPSAGFFSTTYFPVLNDLNKRAFSTPLGSLFQKLIDITLLFMCPDTQPKYTFIRFHAIYSQTY